MNDTPSNSLYVGNLPWDVTSEDLANMFGGMQIGSCEVQKRLSGRSKGFGTVEFHSVEDATAAMSMVVGRVVGERALTVRYDKQMATTMPCNKIFVGNLPWSVTDEVLMGMFQGYAILGGQVKVVKGRSKGYGIVEFDSVQTAELVLQEKSEFEFEGRQIFTRFDRHLE